MVELSNEVRTHVPNKEDFQGRQVSYTSMQDEGGTGIKTGEGTPCSRREATRPSKSKDLCHILIIVNKMDLLFQK